MDKETNKLEVIDLHPRGKWIDRCCAKCLKFIRKEYLMEAFFTAEFCSKECRESYYDQKDCKTQ